MIPPKYGKDFPTQTRKDYPTCKSYFYISVLKELR